MSRGSPTRRRLSTAGTRWLDPHFGNNCLDAHILDRIGDLEDPEVQQVIALWESGELQIVLPHSVKSEIEHPNTPRDVKRRVADFIFTIPVTLTTAENDLHQRVLQIVQGNAKPNKHKKDSFHLVEAAKYARYFITRDRRLLQKRDEIAGLLPQLRIATPAEFLAAYHNHRTQSSL